MLSRLEHRGVRAGEGARQRLETRDAVWGERALKSRVSSKRGERPHGALRGMSLGKFCM